MTDTLQRKDLQRAVLQKANLSPVQHRRLTTSKDLEGFDTYPAIVKRTDS